MAQEISETKENDSSADTDLGNFMQVMDVVDIVRRKDTAVQEQLSFEDQKKAVMEKLRSTYREMGVEATDSQLERAVQDHYSTKWSFEAPKPGAGIGLANMYVNRVKITKNYIMPGAIVGSLVWAGIFGINTAIERSRKVAEEAVESSIEQAFVERRDLETSANNLLVSSYFGQLPENEANEVRNGSSNVVSILRDTDSFFTEMAPNGQADDTVTQGNYKGVQQNELIMQASLGKARESLGKAQSMIGRQEKFVSLDESLENLLAQVKTANPAAPVYDKAEQLYTNGMESINNRKLEDAERANTGLASVLNDVNTFNSLMKDNYTVYSNSASSIAQEELAKQKIKEIDERVKKYATVGDVEGLRKSVNELNEINTALHQEYRVEVVNQPGIRTAVWRESADNPSRNRNDEDPNGKVFYLVVRSVDSNGNEVPVRLINIEDGSVDNVTRWGERIPHEVYLRIKKDKLDNGMVDNSNSRLENRYFAEKKRGYLSVEQIMKDNVGNPLGRIAQLTREENNWRAR